MDRNLHLNNAAVCADIQYFTAELVGEVGDALQMLMLVSQSFTESQLGGVEIVALPELCCSSGSPLLGQSLSICQTLLIRRRQFSVVCEQLLEVFRTQDVDLGQEKLTLDKGGGGVVQDGPDRDQIFQLASGLLHDAVLSTEHNGHAGEILYLGAADDQAVNVEASGGENARYAGQDTGFILHQAVEDVTLGRCCGGHWRLIQNIRDGSLRTPCGRQVRRGQRGDAAVQGLVCQSGG